jgi:hypothetical protein
MTGTTCPLRAGPEVESAACLHNTGPADVGRAASFLETGKAGVVVAILDWMTEAVALLPEVMVWKMRQEPAWTSLLPFRSKDRQLALRKSNPRMAIWTSLACRKVQVKNWPDRFSCTWHSHQHLMCEPVGPTMLCPEEGRPEEQGRMLNSSPLSRKRLPEIRDMEGVEQPRSLSFLSS